MGLGRSGPCVSVGVATPSPRARTANACLTGELSVRQAVDLRRAARGTANRAELALSVRVS